MTTDSAALYRLMAWLSPAYPVGAFSYSSGLEWAIEAGDITDAATLIDWLTATMRGGSGFCDAAFFVHAHRAVSGGDDAALRAVAELAAAFAPSKERHLETTAQGRAFLDTTRAAWPTQALETLEPAVKAGLGKKLGIQKRLVAVEGTRKIGKKNMIYNGATPDITIDAETYEVRADGELLTCEPAKELPMAQRYFLY